MKTTAEVNAVESKSSFRIRYRKVDGAEGVYYLAEQNTAFVATMFSLKTGRPKDCIISIEVKVRRKWVKVP